MVHALPSCRPTYHNASGFCVLVLVIVIGQKQPVGTEADPTPAICGLRTDLLSGQHYAEMGTFAFFRGDMDGSLVLGDNAVGHEKP